MIFGLKGSETFGLGDLAGFDLHRQGPSLVFAKELHFSLSLTPASRLPPEGVKLLLAAILGHIGEVVCGESLLNFSGLRAGVPQVSPQGGTSRLGAAAPFVSIGRGAAPSGPLTSGNAITASRRQGWRASPRGVGRRRRAVPTPEKGGASRLNLGSAQRAAPTL